MTHTQTKPASLPEVKLWLNKKDTQIVKAMGYEQWVMMISFAN